MNKRRSLTAEKIFDGYNGHRARSAETEKNARIKVTPGLLGWADIIFCMEKKHVRRIKEKYSDIVANKKVICLNISDEYEFMDRELQELLKSSVEEDIQADGNKYGQKWLYMLNKIKENRKKNW